MGWRRSLRTRLVLLSSISSALLMVVVAVIFYAAMRSLLVDNARGEVRSLAEQTTRGLAATLGSVQVSGQNLAASAAGIGRDPLDLRTLLMATVGSDPDIFGAMLIIEPGRLSPDDPGFSWYVRRSVSGYTESTVPDLGYDYRVMDWYIRTTTAAGPWWSEPYASAATGGTTYITYNLPLRRPGEGGLPGAAIGMVSVDVPLARLNALLGEVPDHRELRPTLISPERRLVLHPDPAMRSMTLDQVVAGGRTDLAPMLQALREGQPIAIEHVAMAGSDGVREGQDRYSLGFPIGNTGWAFALSASNDYVLAELNRITLWVVLVGLCGVLLSMALVRRTSGLIAKPIEDLTESARQFGLGEFDQAFGHQQREDEVGVMARAFDGARSSIRQQMDEIADMGAARQRLESELNIAREIQLAMLPQPHEFDAGDVHVEFHGMLVAAKAVGGDFYNLFERDGDSVWFVIGDVSDKGVPAALFMTRTMTVLEVAAQLGGSPGRALHEAAKHLVENNETCMFATVLCGVIELRTGALSLASAGHEPPVLLRANGAREFLPVPSEAPLGVSVADTYPVWRGRLLPGDTLFTYTDGITEAFDRGNEAFGTQRLLDALDPSLDARAQCQRVVDATNSFAGDAPQSDDITVFALRYKRDSVADRSYTVKARLDQPLPADPVRALLAEVDAGLAGHGLPATVMHDMHLVIEEVACNILSHGSALDGPGPALEFVATVQGSELAMEFRDTGMPFDPLSQPSPDLDADIVDRPIGGLGVHLVRELAEQVAYSRDKDYNVLRVVLHIPYPEPTA
ncbi:SpoIIE family protein phosphatase [Arenimonas sp. MALMAid1274]|uniref:SpoIIE family protein phosphatase n=1 Tax=Arenimonas sp. MALMAid1274 TaxID=3411630 RepID=UPI003BA252DE